MQRHQKYASAVDAAGEADADRFTLRKMPEPLGGLFRQGSDVLPADFIEV
jgi:hypothetical protein